MIGHIREHCATHGGGGGAARHVRIRPQAPNQEGRPVHQVHCRCIIPRSTHQEGKPVHQVHCWCIIPRST